MSAYLLLLPERQKTNAGNLDDLETDTGNITLSLTPTTEAGDQDLIVLVDEVEATIVLQNGSIRIGAHRRVTRPEPRLLESAPGPTGHRKRGRKMGTYRHERGDLLSVFDELDTDALADGRVGLLGFNADLLEHDALCVGGASSGGGLVDVAEGALLVRLVRLSVAKVQRSHDEDAPNMRPRWGGSRVGGSGRKDSPSDFHGGRCATCALPAIHEVCWLENRFSMASERLLGSEQDGSNDLQPILAGVLSGRYGGRGLLAEFECKPLEL